MSALFLTLALWLQAVEPPPAEVCTVTASMLDEEGAAVLDLRPDEVALLENGVARTLRRVELDDRPLRLAVIVDSSQPVATAFRQNLVDAVLGLLNRLPPDSQFAVWTTGDRPTKVVDDTDDPAAAMRALKKVFPRGGNTLLDALVEASDELEAEEGARTAVVVVTGAGVGFANYDRLRVVERASRNTMQLMSVEFTEGAGGHRAVGPGAVGQQDYEYVLSALAERTGGLNLISLTAMGVAKKLRQIAAELRGQYRLSYSTLPGLERRNIEIQLARPEVRVRVGSTEGGC